MDINQYPKVRELLRKQVDSILRSMFSKMEGMPVPEVIEDRHTDTVIDAIVAQNPRPLYKLLDYEGLVITLSKHFTWTAAINNSVYMEEFDDRVKAEEFILEEAFKMLEAR